MSNILVIPTDELQLQQGFVPMLTVPYPIYGLSQWRARDQMEVDPTFKQIIPYIIMVHIQTSQVYTYWRSGAEKRLHGKKSLGIGGHVDQADGDLYTAMYREILEEVDVEDHGPPRFLGCVNEDESKVGQVHFGLVFQVCINYPIVTPREETKGGKLEPIDDLNIEEFELWSQHVLHDMRRVSRYSKPASESEQPTS